MNDNEHALTPHWAQQFCGHTDESLLAALGVLGGLLDKPHAFENCAADMRRRGSLIAYENGTRVSPIQMKADILNAVCEKHDVTMREIMGARQSSATSDARNEACYRLREEMGLSFSRIGSIMGGRDHSTALNSWRRHKGVLEGRPYVKPRYRKTPNVSA